jgi:hypothetical protein
MISGGYPAKALSVKRTTPRFVEVVAYGYPAKALSVNRTTHRFVEFVAYSKQELWWVFSIG